MSEKRRVILSAKDMNLAIQRIALQILEKNHDGSDLAIVGIYSCGVNVAQKIHEFIEIHTGSSIPFGSLDINLYRDDWSLISQKPIVKTTDIPFDVDNINLILVDDVIFTGRTIRAAMDAVMDYGRPNTIQLAVLVDRGGRELPIQPDFTGVDVAVQANERITVVFDQNNKDGEVFIES